VLVQDSNLPAEKLHTDKEQCRNEDCEPDPERCDEGVMVRGTNKYGYQMIKENLVMPLINAVQELDAENTALKARVTTLEG
jgi:hypothetical protein